MRSKVIFYFFLTLVVFFSASIFTAHAQDSSVVFTQTLQVGSRGDQVKRLQEFLKKSPDIYPEGKVTGYFGLLTKKAVIRFQTREGINPTGIVSPTTRARLNALLLSGVVGALLPNTGNIGETGVPGTTGKTGAAGAIGATINFLAISIGETEVTNIPRTYRKISASSFMAGHVYCYMVTPPGEGKIDEFRISVGGTHVGTCIISEDVNVGSAVLSSIRIVPGTVVSIVAKSDGYSRSAGALTVAP